MVSTARSSRRRTANLLDRNFGREPLFIYLQAISVAVLGQTTLALRAVSAVLGILTVVVAYLLARRMFDAPGRTSYRRLAHACPFGTLIFSRMGLRSISLPLFLAVGFYCLWRGLEEVGARPTPRPCPQFRIAQDLSSGSLSAE